MVVTFCPWRDLKHGRNPLPEHRNCLGRGRLPERRRTQGAAKELKLGFARALLSQHPGHRLHGCPEAWPSSHELARISHSCQGLIISCTAFGPRIVHCHSPCLVPLDAVRLVERDLAKSINVTR